MTAPICGSIADLNPAVSLVNNGWSVMQGYQLASFNLATSAISNLQKFTIAPLDVTLSFDPTGTLTPFQRPTAPSLDPIASQNIDAGAAGLPVFSGIQDPQLLMYPGAPNAPAGPNFPTQPGPLVATLPGTPPTIATDPLPTAPTFNDPTLPTLLNLNLPTLTPLNLPTFNSPPIDFTVAPPSGNITFVPTNYSDALLDQVKAQLASMMQGNIGLPAAVEQALFDRARGREDTNAAKAAQDIRDEFAARGFSLPPGAMAARLDETRQNTQNQSNALSREVYIKAQDILIENMRFSVEKTIALEGVLTGVFMRMQELTLQSQQLVLDASIKVFDAQVAIFNAREQARAIDAQVYREQLQGELAKVQIYTAQIEAEKTKVAINHELVAIYEAQIRATMTYVERYKALIDAARLGAERDKLRLEAFHETVSVYEAQVRAHAVDWEAYRSAVEGEVAKGTYYQTLANVYATNVRAISDQNTIAMEKVKTQAQLRELDLHAYQSRLEVVKLQLENDRNRVIALGTKADALARIYQASAAVETAAAESSTREFQANTERAHISANLKIERSKELIAQAVQLGTLMVEQLKGVTAAASQMVASTMSGVHFAAQASSGYNASTSSSCNNNVNYSAV